MLPKGLDELQRGLADVALHNALTPMLESVEAARGSRERRLGVYRSNTLNSLTDVLTAAYPVIERIVGARFFRAAAAAFIEEHPPREPVLYRYGADFAGFLESFEPARTLSYLPHVARLEWARIESYFAPDAAPLDPQRLSEVPAEHLAGVVFTLHPATQLIKAPCPIFEIWAINQPDQDNVPEIDLSSAEQGLVWRPDHSVVQRVVSPGTYTWLTALAAGDALGPATVQAGTAEPEFDLQNALQQHLADGAFTDIAF